MASSVRGAPASDAASAPAAAVLPGPGEMAARCRAFDWASTPLGPADAWPQSLRTAAAVVLALGFPATLAWGPELTQLYNDACVPIHRARHPAVLGTPLPASLPRVWPRLAPIFERVRAGETVTLAGQRFPAARGEDGLAAEDRYFDVSYAPVRAEDGRVGGVLVTGVDTTAQVRARALQQARAAAERQLQSAFAQAPAAVAVTEGPEHRYVLVNARAEALVGRAGLVGRTYREAFPELDGQGFAELLDRVYATGVPVVLRRQHAHYHRGATRVEGWFDAVYQPLRDTDGRVTGVMQHVIDVTEQVLAQEALEQSNQQLEEQQVELVVANQQLQENAVELEVQAEELQATAAELEARIAEAEAARARVEGNLEAMADAYFALDAGYCIVAVNAAMERASGLPRARLLGRDFWALFPGALGTDIERYYRRAVTERLEAHFTHDYRDARLDLVVDLDAYPAAGGGVVVFWRDVTARVRSEAALRASEAKYRTLFASMDQAFCIVEVLFDADDRPVDYRFVEANPVFEQQTGLVGAVGRTALELVPGLETFWLDIYGRVARTGEPVRFENAAEPMGRWFDVYAFRTGAPEANQVAVLLTDVSAAKVAERERERLLAAERAARAEAEAANRGKSEFLAVMSHELRTPLNAIGGYAELIEMGVRGPVTAEQRSDLERIQRAQRHLLGLINGVLNYARIDAGAVHYDVTDVELDEVLSTCESLVAPQVRAKGLALHHAPRPLRARGDRDKVQQVVLNLLSNAVKFTDAGGRITLSHEVGEDGGVRVVVADTGRGIPADQLARVFEPFVQVDARLTRTQEGTGLGLAISRDLARGMGGDLTAASEVGVGSIFTFRLPRG